MNFNLRCPYSISFLAVVFIFLYILGYAFSIPKLYSFIHHTTHHSFHGIHTFIASFLFLEFLGWTLLYSSAGIHPCDVGGLDILRITCGKDSDH